MCSLWCQPLCWYGWNNFQPIWQPIIILLEIDYQIVPQFSSGEPHLLQSLFMCVGGVDFTKRVKEGPMTQVWSISELHATGYHTYWKEGLRTNQSQWSEIIGCLLGLLREMGIYLSCLLGPLVKRKRWTRRCRKLRVGLRVKSTEGRKNQEAVVWTLIGPFLGTKLFLVSSVR